MSNKLAEEVRTNAPAITPPDLDYLLAHLREKNLGLVTRFNELSASFDKTPETILDDVVQGNVADLNKMFRSLGTDLENQRKLEKEPWDKVAAAVHAFFIGYKDKVADKRDKLGERQEAYTKRKADAEREKLREEAARRQAEVDAALAAAAESERKRIEAEEKAKEAEAAAEQAERDRKDAIARAEKAEQEARDAKQREADAAAAALAKQAEAAQKGEDAGEDVEAETDAARADRIAKEQEAAAAKDAVKQSTEKVSAAKAGVAVFSTEVKQAARSEKTHMQQALRSEERAAKVEEKADEGDAELGRVRSEYGTVATVQKRWTFRINDAAALPASILWHLVSMDAKEAAVSRYVQQGGRKLAGVVIFEDTIGVAR